MRDSHTKYSDIPNNSCFLCEGSALLILLAARDLIHAGWRLLHHPLYGNYRPYQQPYRSALLALGSPVSGGAHGRDAAGDVVQRVIADTDSLHFIEEALGVFRDSRILTPDAASSCFLKDCAVIDFELMRLPLQQAGLPDYLAPAA